MRACDICGAGNPEVLLRSARLDGPLVRCRVCELVYVGRRESDFTFRDSDAERSHALATRVAELQIVQPEVDEAEHAWRMEAEQARLARLRAVLPAGRLLDVGSSTGTFLSVARSSFDVSGVEPDPSTSAQAQAKGLDVVAATLEEVSPPRGGFDAVTMFHVIEHLDAPREAAERVRELVRPGGIVLIETPTVDCLWFRFAFARPRWRQLIPDHYFFFSRQTLERLLRQCGFDPIGYEKVGRRASLRFVADRLRRSGVPLTAPLPDLLARMGLADRSVYLNPGDIMSVVARAR
jgi:2-polyprenyl-3-methyl-5-hydroxy-6-metoxy-1,4-benzoquinol methylase